MPTSEYRAVDAESDLPISAAELAALANQLYAASVRPGFDSPPQSAPIAPRGNVPDTTAAASAGQTAGGGGATICPPPPAPPPPSPPAATGAGPPARNRPRHDGRAVGRRNDRQRRR